MSGDQNLLGLDDNEALVGDLVRIAEVALASGSPQAMPLLRKMARRYRESRPTLANALVALLRGSPTRGATEIAAAPAPMDTDTRLPLVRQEDPVVLPVEPVLSPRVRDALHQVAAEHIQRADLLQAGLAPTRTALFVGPPGVGKTLAARWLAHELAKPLVVLDLASVMSSFLGRTGANVRRVLDYAKATPGVLLLDELDAVAKRRDDATEIGELKRLVTVLLQEIDNWPEGSLLIAATNHSELLDPAVWRRFEIVVDFPLPGQAELVSAIIEFLDDPSVARSAIEVLAASYDGSSFSQVERDVMNARRSAALRNIPVTDALLAHARSRLRSVAPAERSRIAVALMDEFGVSQRRARELTGVSRDTLRKRSSKAGLGTQNGDMDA